MTNLLQTIYKNHADLPERIKIFIAQNVDLNGITEYGESALRVASNNGRFDVVRLLLDAGADPTQLEWTATAFEVVFGTLASIKESIQRNGDLEAVDFWSRTPLLLAIQLGDIGKASLLLELGANRKAVGRCNKPALAYAIQNNHLPMSAWLLAQGFDIEARDDFQDTPLIFAAEHGMVECVKLLIESGADIDKANQIDYRAIRVASNLETVHVLVRNGADINDISPEMRAQRLGIGHDEAPQVSKEDYLAGKFRQFGSHNAQETQNPFWFAMVRAGASAYCASEMFLDSGSEPGRPVWCYQRYGRSTTQLADGRIIEIGGEHEDFYDRDFCIYNDVVAFDGHGGIRLFSYPAEVFPPTDFHSATLVGDVIYIIGNLSYPELRQPGLTPVYSLNTTSFEITKVVTEGEMPGWISRHKAELVDGNKITITGGSRMVIENGNPAFVDNSECFQLCLNSFVWKRL